MNLCKASPSDPESVRGQIAVSLMSRDSHAAGSSDRVPPTAVVDRMGNVSCFGGQEPSASTSGFPQVGMMPVLGPRDTPIVTNNQRPDKRSPSSQNPPQIVSRRKAKKSNSQSQPNGMNVELPPGYEIRVTDQGQVYFYHVQTGRSTYHHPALPKDFIQSHSNGDYKNVGALPPGWEQRSTPTGKPYFLDHNTRTTHFTDPRIFKTNPGVQTSGSSSSNGGTPCASTPDRKSSSGSVTNGAECSSSSSLNPSASTSPVNVSNSSSPSFPETTTVVVSVPNGVSVRVPTGNGSSNHSSGGTRTASGDNNCSNSPITTTGGSNNSSGNNNRDSGGTGGGSSGSNNSNNNQMNNNNRRNNRVSTRENPNAVPLPPTNVTVGDTSQLLLVESRNCSNNGVDLNIERLNLNDGSEMLPKYKRDLNAKIKALKVELQLLQPRNGHCRVEVSRKEIFEVRKKFWKVALTIILFLMALVMIVMCFCSNHTDKFLR